MGRFDALALSRTLLQYAVGRHCPDVVGVLHDELEPGFRHLFLRLFELHAHDVGHDERFAVVGIVGHAVLHADAKQGNDDGDGGDMACDIGAEKLFKKVLTRHSCPLYKMRYKVSNKFRNRKTKCFKNPLLLWNETFLSAL